MNINQSYKAVLLFIYFYCHLTAAAATPLTLKVQAWAGYAEPSYVQAFQEQLKKKSGLDVEVIVTPTTGLASFESAIQTQEADLITPSNDLLEILWQKKLIRPLDTKKIPNFHQINPLILQRRFHLLAGEVYAVPFTFGPYALVYNKSKMEKPNSYKVLWDERYRKRVSISRNFEVANIYMTALFLKIPVRHLFNLSDTELSRIEERLRQLHDLQIYDYWKEYLNPDDIDNVDVGTDWGFGVHEINTKKNGEWGIVIPDEGATAWVDSWSIAANIPPEKLELAYAFINFMLSAPIQAQVARQTTYGTSNFYTTRYMTVKERINYHVTDPEYLRRFILWQPLAPSVLEKYQATWKKATQE
ncbi:ABC transporter substrate-binding protein [Beggiatoa leptomitoformis]|uniref:Extracellular solute-binding protein n=1 Tax=Beggiatoa leptomitoformis TaxID=288004 RepID=A0A2N9YAF9_9GAMM|nr:extracellular solute-binding protein [Beggiatoa leptomitoformis]ALG67151.1 extracellular solute-binding protein [Beggiatoa leptomitoformis]AUI67448.1 extracellular solute-binding protein [Beggiatoa leptomitoformis]